MFSIRPVRFRRAGNRHDPRFLREQTRRAELGGRRLLAAGHLAEDIDERLVRLSRLGREARHDVSEIRRREGGALVNFCR